jgi:hypothetical protein
MKENPTENPKPRKKVSVLKAAILGAVVFGGISLAFIWWSSYKNYAFEQVSIVGLILGIAPFIVSDFINLISKFLGFAHFAFIVTDTRTFCVIVNGFVGAVIGYWIGCESRNRQRS